MKFYAIVSPGLEKIAAQEIKEKCSVSGSFKKHVVEFETDANLAAKLVHSAQSLRRVFVAIGCSKNVLENDFSDACWDDFLQKEASFKVEVEHVSGEEVRRAIQKHVATKVFESLEKNQSYSPKIELEKPDVIIFVYHNGEEYFVGVDITGVDLSSREFRVFPHSGSFKGDVAYYFARKSGVAANEKMLVGFCKDGAIAIEAAIYLNNIALNAHTKFLYANILEFSRPTIGKKELEENNTVFAFDEGMQNVTASKKNVKIAQAPVEVSKYSLEDLDVKYDEGEFDRLIFHVTTKDESRINEIYYQASYILKKGGTVLFIGRKNWELSISDKFELVTQEELMRGESAYKLWLLRKK